MTPQPFKEVYYHERLGTDIDVYQVDSPQLVLMSRQSPTGADVYTVLTFSSGVIRASTPQLYGAKMEREYKKRLGTAINAVTAVVFSFRAENLLGLYIR